MVNVKATPGSIPAPNSGSFIEKIRKILVAKWGKPTKNQKKVFNLLYITLQGKVRLGPEDCTRFMDS